MSEHKRLRLRSRCGGLRIQLRYSSFEAARVGARHLQLFHELGQFICMDATEEHEVVVSQLLQLRPVALELERGQPRFDLALGNWHPLRRCIHLSVHSQGPGRVASAPHTYRTMCPRKTPTHAPHARSQNARRARRARHYM